MLALFFLAVFTHSAVARPAWAGEGTADGRQPSYFEGIGHIDALAGDQIVIDDRQRKISSNAKYFRIGGSPISRSSFGVGSKVGFRINQRGEIVSLWLLK